MIPFAELLAELKAMRRRIDVMAFQVDALARQRRLGCHRANLDLLKHIVAEAFHVPPDTMHIRDRHADNSWPRQVAMALSREILGYSWSAIGRAFRRDRGTVHHAFRTVRDRCDTDPRDAQFIASLRRELRARFPQLPQSPNDHRPNLSPLCAD